jgi:hypothetical protein
MKQQRELPAAGAMLNDTHDGTVRCKPGAGRVLHQAHVADQKIPLRDHTEVASMFALPPKWGGMV